MNSSLIAQPRRLPVVVSLVRHETIPSYIRRLAAANHLNPNGLIRYINAARDGRLEVLEAMTGHRTDRLDDVLVTNFHPWLHRRQEACHRCAGRRGITVPVHLAAPVDHTVCHRHERWLPGSSNPGDQHQCRLHDLREVLIAQRHHRQLVRDHGVDQATAAYTAAEHVTQRWAHRGDWPQHRNQRLQQALGAGSWRIDPAHPLITMVNYPETIALAHVLANPYWTRRAISDNPDEIAAFHAEVGRRLHIPYLPYTGIDPLLQWQARARAIRHHAEIAQVQRD